MRRARRLGKWRRFGIAIAVLAVFSPVRLAAGPEAHDAVPASPPGHIVEVSAGEHGEFSRVVLAIGDGRTYRAEPEPAGIRLVFPGARLGFAYDRVYPGRRAHRVVTAEPGADAEGSSLRLGFGCDCSARVFRLGGRLVVDVFDAGPDASQALPPRGAAAAERVVAAPASGHPALPAADAATPQKPVNAATQAQPRAEFLQRVESLNSPAPLASPGAVPEGAGFNPDHLERMIAWAIEHGHLTSAAASDDASASPDAPGDALAPVDGEVAPDAAQPQGADEQVAPPPLVQRPSAAPEPSSAQKEPAEAGGSPACPDGAAIDMAALAGAGSFADELARRQDALGRALASGDRLAEAQHALAGFYLARLMPHEALQILRKADGEAPTPTARWLEAIALVLADRAGAMAGPALQEASCSGADVRLWQALLHTADGPVPPQALAGDEILLRLAAYPADLRVEIALRLAEAGIDAKAPDAIARLLDMVEQAAPVDEARARLLFLRGRLAAARGDFTGARASWEEAQHLPGEGGLRATLALLGWNLEHDALDEAAALAALERLAYDWRGHPAQLTIARLAAAIHERQGRVSMALRAIEEVALGAEGQPAGRAAARLATDLMRRAYAEPPAAMPIDELAVFWRYEGFVPPGAEGADIRLAFAEAMLAHGLPSAALRALEPAARHAPEGPVHDRLIDLVAEARLAADQPAATLDLLRAEARASSASRPDRNQLAARALAALGRFAEAAGVLHDDTGAGSPQRQADYLWKAGLWQQASAAYRRFLQTPPQGEADPEAAVRLAAAAYMAGEPVSRAPGPAGFAVEDAGAAAAFAPLPGPAGSADRSVAARLLDQAASLGGLAERYGLGGAQTP